MKKALVFIFAFFILIASIRLALSAGSGDLAPQQRLDSKATPTFNGMRSTGTITAPKFVGNIDAVQVQATVYTAATMTVNTGTLISGTVSDMASIGSGSVTIGEATGADPLRVTFTFTGVISFNNIRIRSRYDASSLDHSIAIELYNNNTAIWDRYGTILDSSDWAWYSEPIFDGTSYIANGTVLARLRHIESGKNSHTLYLDYISVQQGSVGGGTLNHGSLPDLAVSGHPASIISFTPASGLSSTNTQSAISELAARNTGTNTGDQSYVASAGVATYAISAGSTTGNAATVTNGVYTSGSYTDPSWINTLSGSKITGTVPAATYAASAGTASTAMALNSSGANTGGSLSLTTPLGESSGGTGTNHVQWKLLPQCVTTVSSTVTGTTAKTTLFSCIVSGGSIATNGKLTGKFRFEVNNNGNSKIITVEFAGSAWLNLNLASIVSYHDEYEVINRNSASVQIGSVNKLNQYGTSGGPNGTSSANTLLDQTLLVSCTLANANDYCVLKTFDAHTENP